MEQESELLWSKHDLLLGMKLIIPQTHPCLVSRAHLITRLEEAVPGSVILVSAPAGFGKTMLVAEWAQQPHNRVAWLSVDEGDNHPQRFWRYVIAALAAVADGIGARSLPAVEAAGPEEWEQPLTLLLNEIAIAATEKAPLTLILDDYHLIARNTIHQSLSFLLTHQPHSLRIVLLSRSDPPLGLSRLRVQGRLQELRAADLQFTIAEMEAFLRCFLAVALPDEIVEVLARRIEGWAAGLQLAALSLKASPPTEWTSFIQAFSGRQRHVLSYLLEEVIQRQPEEVQSFLLQTAVLRHLNPALCAFVTGRQDSDQILAELAAENLFIIPLDESGHWYRYQRLFLGALRTQLEKKNPQLIPELQRRAAAWYAEQGLKDEPNPLLQPLLDPLTGRELEILLLIARGLSNQQIADQLNIGLGTVKGHINHLLSKLGAQNRTEAVAHARRLGLLKT